MQSRHYLRTWAAERALRKNKEDNSVLPECWPSAALLGRGVLAIQSLVYSLPSLLCSYVRHSGPSHRTTETASGLPASAPAPDSLASAQQLEQPFPM